MKIKNICNRKYEKDKSFYLIYFLNEKFLGKHLTTYADLKIITINNVWQNLSENIVLYRYKFLWHNVCVLFYATDANERLVSHVQCVQSK